MSVSENWLKVGKIVAPQGLNGEVRVLPLSDFPERFTKSGVRWLQASIKTPNQVFLIKGRKLPGKEIYVVKFKEINDRESAELIVSQSLLVLEKDRPKMSKNEFHLLDLVGLDAKLKENGLSIGKVTNLNTGNNQLLEIALLEGKTVLIPFVKEIVPEVNIKEGWILVDPPPGLLDL